MKKLIKTATIVAGISAIFSFTGCGNDGPDKVAVKFYENYTAGNVESAKKYVSEQSAMLISFAMEIFISKGLVGKAKGAKFEAIETKVDGDSATVKIRITPKEGEAYVLDDPIPLIKQNGVWKVHAQKGG